MDIRISNSKEIQMECQATKVIGINSMFDWWPDNVNVNVKVNAMSDYISYHITTNIGVQFSQLNGLHGDWIGYHLMEDLKKMKMSKKPSMLW